MGCFFVSIHQNLHLKNYSLIDKLLTVEDSLNPKYSIVTILSVFHCIIGEQSFPTIRVHSIKY